VQNIITLIDVAVNQNYFKYNNLYSSQQKGLAIGALSSAILSEIFIENLEHNELYRIITKHEVLNYFRYVDDTLIIYGETKTYIGNALSGFSMLYRNLQFTMEKENNKAINYLDKTVIRKPTKFLFNTYRRPTTISTVIHSISCHPAERKIIAFNCLYSSVKEYPLPKCQKQNKLNIIRQTATENNYKTTKLPKVTSHTVTQPETQKRAKRSGKILLI
jgi:hypothetical protein